MKRARRHQRAASRLGHSLNVAHALKSFPSFCCFRTRRLSRPTFQRNSKRANEPSRLSRAAEQRQRGRVKEEKCFNSSEWPRNPLVPPPDREIWRAKPTGEWREGGQKEKGKNAAEGRHNGRFFWKIKVRCYVERERERAIGGMVGVKIKIADRKRGYGPPRRSSTRLEATGNGPCNLKAAARN